MAVSRLHFGRRGHHRDLRHFNDHADGKNFRFNLIVTARTAEDTAASIRRRSLRSTEHDAWLGSAVIIRSYELEQRPACSETADEIWTGTTAPGLR